MADELEEILQRITELQSKIEISREYPMLKDETISVKTKSSMEVKPNVWDSVEFFSSSSIPAGSSLSLRIFKKALANAENKISVLLHSRYISQTGDYNRKTYNNALNELMEVIERLRLKLGVKSYSLFFVDRACTPVEAKIHLFEDQLTLQAFLNHYQLVKTQFDTGTLPPRFSGSYLQENPEWWAPSHRVIEGLKLETL